MEYKLKELFDLQMGKTPSRNNSDYWNTKDNKWISIADLSKCEKYITETKEYISDIAIKESGINPIPANTVVMSFKLSIGKTAITKEVIYSNEAVMSFRDKKTIELLPDYTYYLMMSKRWDEGTNNAVMGKTLNKATLSEIKVSVHDIAEQQRIVNVLDKLTTLIDKRQKQLEKLDELVKSRFIELFGDPKTNPMKWDMVTIGNIATDVRYGTSRPATEDGKYPYLRMNNLTYEGYLDLKDLKYIDIPDNEVEKCVVRYGDVLFNRTNSVELVGKTCVYNLDYDTIIAGYIIRVRIDDRILPVVFSNYLNSKVLKEQLRNMAKGAVNQANINSQELKSIPIYLPPIDLQNEFVAFVKQVDKSKFDCIKYHNYLERILNYDQF